MKTARGVVTVVPVDEGSDRMDTSKNRWQLGLITDSVLSGARGIGDGGTAGIF